MRILAVDPGEKRLGIAISDPTGKIANPLIVLNHTQRNIDAAAIVQIAADNDAGKIVVGQSFDDEGQPTPAGRSAARLAEAIRQQTNLPVVLWDESDSTQAARKARIAVNASRRKRSGHLDELAATFTLQTYLDDETR